MLVTRTCPVCGDQALIYPSRLVQKFCSRQCAGYARRRSVEERFWTKVNKTETCWLWTGSMTHGYGKFGIPGKPPQGAHRISYELIVGPIPNGLHLDHLCRNRACVNPTHLEPVTCKDNVLRGEGGSAQNARKTHCKHGHPFDETNTYFVHTAGRSGGRVCRTCGRLRKRVTPLVAAEEGEPIPAWEEME